MPIYDFQCPECGVIEDVILLDYDKKRMKCPNKCGKFATKIISGSHRKMQDAAWIRSITDVVDRESTDPATVEFRKNPTRETMKQWMKSNNLRHFEPGEESFKRVEPDMTLAHKYVKEQFRKNHTINVRG